MASRVEWVKKKKEKRRRLREDGDHFTAGAASENDALQAFGEHLNELHVVGLTAWRHLARNARHVDNDQLRRVALVDDVLV